jgi:hypothetical protein
MVLDVNDQYVKTRVSYRGLFERCVLNQPGNTMWNAIIVESAQQMDV